MTGSNKGVIILLSVLAVCFSFLVIVIVFGFVIKTRLIAQRRLSSLYENQPETFIPIEKKKKRNKGTKSKLRFSEALTNELHASGIMMRPDEFATFWLVVSFVPSGLLAIFTGNTILSGVVAAIGIVGPLLYVNKQKKKRTAAFDQQLGDALVTMCNCLRSGLTLGQAIENIATDMTEPISKEFARLCTEIKYGAVLEESLNSMAERIGSDDLSLAVTAINIQRQTGGNLSDILAGISDTIRARVKLKADVKVVTASGKVSGLVIGILPIFLGLIIFLINPDYITGFVRSGAGRVMLIIAATMEIIGFILIKKILTIKY